MKIDLLASINIFKFYCIHYVSRGSSVGIVSDYGLDNRAIRGSIPSKGKRFSSSLCVQTGSEVHPASCPMGIVSPIPKGKSAAGA
jgi:hypothetical protein